MKKLLVLFAMVVMIACSSNSSDSDNDNTSPPESFSILVNGEDPSIGLYNNFATRSEQMITLENPFFTLSFDETERLGQIRVNVHVGPGDLRRDFYSHANFSSNYFTFDLISLDQENRRVKGEFTGYVYADPLNLESESKFVSGQFDLNYQILVPAVLSLKNEAKLNGSLWTRTASYLTKDPANINSITQHDLNDGQYKLMIHYNTPTIAVGTYNFSPADASNKVTLAKYDPAAEAYTFYHCTGTMTVTRKESTGQERFIMSGHYDFTATNPTNPAEVIEVTDGEFKLFYRFFQ